MSTIVDRRASIGAQRNPASEAAILDAAEALLVEHGASGFSIEAVARLAHAGKPTIYRWWPNRAALLLAVYARQKQSLPVPRTGSLRGDLEAFMSSAIRFWRTTPAGRIFRSILAEAQQDPEAARVLAAYGVERQAASVAAFSRELPDIPLQQIAVVAELVMAFCHYRLMTNQLDDDPETFRAVAERLTAGVEVK